MKAFLLTALLLLLACAPAPLEPELIEEYIPVPVVKMIIVDGDTLYDVNQ